MLDMLSNPEQYHHIWQQLGVVDPVEQAEIRSMVARGTIFLAHPLLDHKRAISNSTINVAKKIPWYLGSRCLQVGFYWATRAALSCTAFDYERPTQISMIMKNIHSEKWPYSIIISLAQPDEITGNEYDKTLSLLGIIYPEKLTVIKGGKNHHDIRASVHLCREQLSCNNSFLV